MVEHDRPYRLAVVHPRPTTTSTSGSVLALQQVLELLQVGPDCLLDRMDLGESLVDTAIRETIEETGITCEITGLVGIYTDPKHVILYTSDGEARQEFSVVFTARPISGSPTTSSETRLVEWVDRTAVADLPMDRSMRLRIEHFLSGRPAPHLG